MGLVVLLLLPAQAAGLTLVRTVESPSGLPGGFGYSMTPLAGGGTSVLFGTPAEPLAEVLGGAAYVVDIDTGDGEATIENPTPFDLDLFGFSAAQLGSKLLLGAPGDDAAAQNGGAVYVLDAATMVPSGTLPNPSGLAEAGSGGA